MATGIRCTDEGLTSLCNTISRTRQGTINTPLLFLLSIFYLKTNKNKIKNEKRTTTQNAYTYLKVTNTRETLNLNVTHISSNVSCFRGNELELEAIILTLRLCLYTVTKSVPKLIYYKSI